MNNGLIGGNYEDLFVFPLLIYNGEGEVGTTGCALCESVSKHGNSAFRRDRNLKTATERSRSLNVRPQETVLYTYFLETNEKDDKNIF